MSGQGKLSVFNLNFSQFFTGKYGWIKATIMIVLILVAAGWAAERGVNVSVNLALEARVSAIENTLNIPVNSSLSAFRKDNSYIVSLVDSYACLQNGSNAGLREYSVSHSAIIQDALNNASVSGGSVYVAEGSYSAFVTLKDKTRLIIDRGATGITIAGVDAGANCILDDFNNGVFKYYGSGSLYSQFDYANGDLLIASGNITTVYVKTIDSIDGTTVNILKLTVENGTSFPSSPAAGRLYLMNDSLYYWNTTAWVACGGGGGGGLDDDSLYLLSASASNFLLQNGTRPLTADWALNNFGIYQVTYVNVTTLNCATIEELVSCQGVHILQLIVEHGTSFPVVAREKQVFYRDDLAALYVYNNSVWTPVGYTPSSYPYSNLTGTPDLTVYLFVNGSRPLTGSLNLGGSYGLFNATWLNSTSIFFSGQLWYNGYNRTDLIANPRGTCSYIVSPSGSSYLMINETTMQVDYQGSDAGLAITYAAGNLTSGRTWKEEVDAVGSLTISTGVSLPNYTKLRIVGKIKLGNNVNGSMIANANPTTGNTQIEICSGELDGNQANEQTQSGDPIYIYNTTFVSIHDTTIHDSSLYGIKCGVAPGSLNDQVTTFSIDKNIFFNNRNDHIVVGSSGSITNNICNPSVLYNYISLVNASGVSVIGNTLINNTNQYGVGLEYGCSDDSASANNIIDCYIGINVYASPAGGDRLTFSANDIVGNSYDQYGIAIQSGGNDSLSGNIIDGFTNGTKGYAVWLYSTSCNTVTGGNKFRNCRYGMVISGTTTLDFLNSISFNDFSNVTTTFSGYGNYSIVSNAGINPVGYITNPLVGSTTEINNFGGNNATWVSARTYFNNGVPKDFSYNVTEVTAVVVNGQTLNDNGWVHLEASWTISWTFSNVTNANIKPFGE